jgi:hypothetical protein
VFGRSGSPRPGRSAAANTITGERLQRQTVTNRQIGRASRIVAWVGTGP